MHRRDPSSATTSTLPAISEDSASFITPRDAPPVPPRAWNRPTNKQYGFGPSGLPYNGTPPPAYNQYDFTGIEGPNGEKLTEVRKGWGDNKHVAKRGGWKRLGLIALAVILVILALGVGLGVGLKKRNSDNKSS